MPIFCSFFCYCLMVANYRTNQQPVFALTLVDGWQTIWFWKVESVSWGCQFLLHKNKNGNRTEIIELIY